MTTPDRLETDLLVESCEFEDLIAQVQQCYKNLAVQLQTYGNTVESLKSRIATLELELENGGLKGAEDQKEEPDPLVKKLQTMANGWGFNLVDKKTYVGVRNHDLLMDVDAFFTAKKIARSMGFQVGEYTNYEFKTMAVTSLGRYVAHYFRLAMGVDPASHWYHGFMYRQGYEEEIAKEIIKAIFKSKFDAQPTR